MQPYERKVYQIPRKVNEGIRILGLSGKDMALLVPVILFDLAIIVFSNLPVGARIVITVFTGGALYMGLTQTVSSGIRLIEYAKLLYRYYFVDQNLYTLYSGKTRRKDAPVRNMFYAKSSKPSEANEIIISEWDEYAKPTTKDKDIEADLKDLYQELGEFIPKPKNIT